MQHERISRVTIEPRGMGPGKQGRAQVAFIGACLLASVGGCIRPARPATGPSFTVMTYNVNYDMPGAEQTVQVIRQADADIVCLQETTPAWEARLRKELAAQYRHMQFHHVGGAGGLAVLSKVRFKKLFYGKPAGAWHPGWLIRADTPAGQVQILSVHLRPPVGKCADGVYRFTLKAYHRSKAVRRGHIEEFLNGIDLTKPTVVLGDFNEPDNGRAISYMRREKRFADALAQFDPWHNTWRVSRGVLSARGRLDHILHCPKLLCLHARVIRAGGSDHRAVVARFQRHQKQ